jgi:hypothetical protein
MGTTFEGDKGTIYVNRGKLESTPADIVTTPLGANDVRLYVSKNHIDNWYECIKNRKLPICDVEIGHRSATVCHLGSLAMRTGRKLSWNPKTEKLSGNDDAARMLMYAYRSPWKLPGA